MTVAELIAQLQTFNPTLQVVVTDFSSEWGRATGLYPTLPAKLLARPRLGEGVLTLVPVDEGQLASASLERKDA